MDMVIIYICILSVYILIFRNLTNVNSQMSTIFSTARIPTADGTGEMTLEPDMLGTIESSRDYDELTRVWTEFRNYIANSGLKQLYAQYVELNNIAAVENGKI